MSRQAAWLSLTTLALALVASGAPAPPPPSLVPIFDAPNFNGTLQRDSLLESTNAPVWIARFLDKFVGTKDDTSESSRHQKMDAAVAELQALGATVHQVYYNLQMIAFDANAAQLLTIRETWQLRLDYLTPNMFASAFTSGVCPQTDLENGLWGIDRIDQISLPLDRVFSTPGCNCAAGINVFVLDTGIRHSHEEFFGRLVLTKDFIDPDTGNATDSHGHGTHCAGTAVGESYGVAKCATLHAVKVLADTGTGSSAGIIAAMDWIAGLGDSVKPAVASLSLGGGKNKALNDATNALHDTGVVVVVAAGNNGVDACNSSPASAEKAITVGATNINDNRPSFSNFGSCVDLYAPGAHVKSAWYQSDTDFNLLSGTSMATPHVAGAASLIYAANPTMTPDNVKSELLARAVNITIDLGVVPLLNIEGIQDCSSELPKDCDVSQWTQWTGCPALNDLGACGSPQRQRSRVVTIRPTCGGEAYAIGTMDISGRRFTFFPVGTSTYRFCTDDAPELTEAVTPAATDLQLLDDQYKVVQLPTNTQFIFFGVAYDEVYVGSNGYITFGSGDSSFRSFEDNVALGFVDEGVKDEVAILATLDSHFQKPRIAMQFKDLSPNTANEASGEGVFAEIKNDQAPRLVITFNNIRCFANRCGQKLTFQAILFLDGTGVIELNYPSVDNAVYYVPVVGLSPGYQPSDFEEVDFASSANPVCNAQSYFLRAILEGNSALVFSEISFRNSSGYPLPVAVTGATSQYGDGEFWSANAAVDGSTESCYASSNPSSSQEALTFIYEGPITDIAEVVIINGGCFPNVNDTLIVSGGVQTLSVEYKPFTPDDPNNTSATLLWGLLLQPSTVPSAATMSYPASIQPPGMAPISQPSSPPFINAKKTYLVGTRNGKNLFSGFEFVPAAVLEISALGWGTLNVLQADHICRIWSVSTQQSLLEVTLPAGTVPFDSWAVAPASLNPPLVLDPAQSYRLVCSLNFQDGDTYEMHVPSFIQGSMLNSSMAIYTQGVQGSMDGSYPATVVSNVFGAPTFFIGAVPPQLLSTSSALSDMADSAGLNSTADASTTGTTHSASAMLFGGGFAASTPVILADPVQRPEPGVASTVCLCPPSPLPSSSPSVVANDGGEGEEEDRAGRARAEMGAILGALMVVVAMLSREALEASMRRN